MLLLISALFSQRMANCFNQLAPVKSLTLESLWVTKCVLCVYSEWIHLQRKTVVSWNVIVAQGNRWRLKALVQTFSAIRGAILTRETFIAEDSTSFRTRWNSTTTASTAWHSQTAHPVKMHSLKKRDPPDIQMGISPAILNVLSFAY